MCVCVRVCVCVCVFKITLIEVQIASVVLAASTTAVRYIINIVVRIGIILIITMAVKGTTVDVCGAGTVL